MTNELLVEMQWEIPKEEFSGTWHEHFFAPNGTSFPEDEDDIDTVDRFDAIQTQKGNFVVWDVSNQAIVCSCPNKSAAIRVAKALARADWIEP